MRYQRYERDSTQSDSAFRREFAGTKGDANGKRHMDKIERHLQRIASGHPKRRCPGKNQINKTHIPNTARADQHDRHQHRVEKPGAKVQQSARGVAPVSRLSSRVYHQTKKPDRNGRGVVTANNHGGASRVAAFQEGIVPRRSDNATTRSARGTFL